MIADRKLSDANNRIEKYNIIPDAASQCDWWHVVATSVTPGAQALFAQCARLGKQRPCVAGGVIRAEDANNTGDAGGCEVSQRDRRNAGTEACFATATRDMRMTVDKAGDQTSPIKIIFCRARGGQHVLFVTDTKDPAATDQDMTNSDALRGEDSGIGNKLEQLMEPAKKGSIYYTTALALNR